MPCNIFLLYESYNKQLNPNKVYFQGNSSDLLFSLGGLKGFDKVIWEVAEYKKSENPSITLKYRSHDGEEGSLSVFSSHTDVQTLTFLFL